LHSTVIEFQGETDNSQYEIQSVEEQNMVYAMQASERQDYTRPTKNPESILFPIKSVHGERLGCSALAQFEICRYGEACTYSHRDEDVVKRRESMREKLKGPRSEQSRTSLKQNQPPRPGFEPKRMDGTGLSPPPDSSWQRGNGQSNQQRLGLAFVTSNSQLQSQHYGPRSPSAQPQQQSGGGRNF